MRCCPGPGRLLTRWLVPPASYMYILYVPGLLIGGCSTAGVYRKYPPLEYSFVGTAWIAMQGNGQK